VVKLDLHVTAEEALVACRERGVVVRSERELTGHPGSHHWHLGFPSQPGTLELSELHGQVWVQVHPRATQVGLQVSLMSWPRSAAQDRRTLSLRPTSYFSGHSRTVAHRCCGVAQRHPGRFVFGMPAGPAKKGDGDLDLMETEMPGIEDIPSAARRRRTKGAIKGVGAPAG
jgi:hypothetical protein